VNKLLRTSLLASMLVGLALLASMQSASATEYSTIRDQAASGASDVMSAFLASANTDETADSQPQEIDDNSLDLLMQQYREASDRDPVADLLQLFPLASRERIDEFKAMDSAQIAQLLADDPPQQRILALVIARSPRIAGAESAWRAALNRYPQTLFLQDLLSRYQSFTASLTLGIGQEYQNGMIQMNYPIPGMLSLQGRTVEIDAEVAYRNYLREASEALSDTKVLLAQSRNKDELIANSNSSLSLLSILGQVAEVQYITGTRSFSDLVRLQTEQARRRDLVQRLESERDGLLGSLASSLNLPAGSAFGKIGWSDDSGPSLDKDALQVELPQTRQEIVQSTLGLEKMDVMIRMTRRQASPDPTLGMSYLRTGTMPDQISGTTQPPMAGPAGSNVSGDTSMSGMESSGGSTGTQAPSTSNDGAMSMGSSSFETSPMVDYRRSGYGIDFTWANELVDRRAEMAGMLQDMIDMARGMLEMQVNRYNQGLQSESTYSGRIIPNAQAALDVVRIGYSGNENSFSDLIGAELSLLEARNDLANIRMDRRIALAEIERLMDRSISSGQ
jgi:hypothetical protein